MKNENRVTKQSVNQTHELLIATDNTRSCCSTYTKQLLGYQTLVASPKKKQQNITYTSRSCCVRNSEVVETIRPQYQHPHIRACFLLFGACTKFCNYCRKTSRVIVFSSHFHAVCLFKAICLYGTRYKQRTRSIVLLTFSVFFLSISVYLGFVYL